jgi:hypothetical protein
MGTVTKREYLQAILPRYRPARKKGKRAILDEFCHVCGYNRKYAIRLLRRKPPRLRQRPGPRPRYAPDQILLPLKRFWLATDQMCSKRLVAALPLWLPFYEREYGPLPAALQAQLLKISPVTIDRLLKPVRVRVKHRGLSGTRPGTLLKNQIPLQPHHWDVHQPGFLEADTVAHCGDSLAGDFVWSLTLTDLFSGWTENRATWNKGAHGVMTQVRDIELHLPFPILGFDCDNGSEFLNHHLFRYFTRRPQHPVPFTRSRSYHKNDNAHVEPAAAGTHVRQLLGYERFDQPQVVDFINQLYRQTWGLYHNFFCPTLKLQEKRRLRSRYRKHYESPRTPYQRLLDSPHVSPQAKLQLRERFQTLNPFQLKKKIEAQLKIIFNTLRLPPS